MPGKVCQWMPAQEKDHCPKPNKPSLKPNNQKATGLKTQAAKSQ
jgi:hypothetical protein